MLAADCRTPPFCRRTKVSAAAAYPPVPLPSTQHPRSPMPLAVSRAAAALLAASLAVGLFASPPKLASAQQVYELEPEYVYGRNRKPRLGYRKPEVFDPLSDRVYQSGYRDYPPTAIPDELKQVDAMTRIKGMNRILA